MGALPILRARRAALSGRRRRGHLETQLSLETLQPWQPEADYFCQQSQNIREIELSGRRVIMQCWHAEEHRYSSKAREINKHQQERAARDPGGG